MKQPKEMPVFPNPWHAPNNICSRPHYRPSRLLAVDGETSFWELPNSVIAVRNGAPVTECVTVAGARRELAERDGGES